MDSGRNRSVFGEEIEGGEDPDRPDVRWRRFDCGCVFAEKYSGDWRALVKCDAWNRLHEPKLSGVYRRLGEDVEWDD